MKFNRAYKRRAAVLNNCNRAARRNAAHVLARLEVLAVTSVNAPPLTDDQLLAALNPQSQIDDARDYKIMRDLADGGGFFPMAVVANVNGEVQS